MQGQSSNISHLLNLKKKKRLYFIICFTPENVSLPIFCFSLQEVSMFTLLIMKNSLFTICWTYHNNTTLVHETRINMNPLMKSHHDITLLVSSKYFIKISTQKGMIKCLYQKGFTQQKKLLSTNNFRVQETIMNNIYPPKKWVEDKNLNCKPCPTTCF